ncbi:FMRFamide receptor-like [Lingula anatina]|uniref:FMRFamide receptor-like n=1 Tax=Lingula anatina TaxID=7574 RepID=A0A1S3HAW0_LINAN|nr:FMRFamide receptor-like [Lingula anatina]|eukprot:XP_013382264.1 FMRFamide receptor-like [Lingula anatina]
MESGIAESNTSTRLNPIMYGVVDTQQACNCSIQSKDTFFETEYFQSFSDSYRMFRYVLNIAILLPCSILGLAGNALSFVVFRKSGRTMTSTFLLLKTLAVADSLILIYCLFFICVPNLTMIKSTPLLEKYMVFIAESIPYSYPVFFILLALANWIVVLVGLERFIAICHPFRAKLLCTLSKTKKHIIAVFVLAIAFGLPRFWELKVLTVIDSRCHPSCGKVEKQLSVVFTDFGRDPVYVYAYRIVWHTLEIVVIPLIMVGYFNVHLLASLHKMDENGKRLFGQRASTRSTNIMLVVVVLVFIVCQLPLCLTHIINPFRPFFSVVAQDNFQYALETAICLALINHALNFWVYYVAGKRFRRVFMETLFPCCVVPEPRESNGIPLHATPTP